MAPTSQAVGTAFSSFGANINVPWPTHVANDIGLLIIETAGSDPSLTPPTGWDALPGIPVVDVATSAGSKLYVWWKRAASSAEGSAATGATNSHILARIVTFRGCITTGNPWNVVTTGTKTTASTTATVPALTTTISDTLITMIVGRPDDSASTTHFGVPVNSNLTSLTEVAEAGTINGDGGGFVVSTGIKSTAGNTGTSTLTKTASTTDTYIVLALQGGTSELVGTTGTFTLSGINTGLLQNSLLNNTVSSFNLTGNNLILSQTVALNTTVGSFNLNGINTDLIYIPVVVLELLCQTSPFTWTGISNILAQQLVLNNTNTSFLINGLSINQQRSFALNGTTGSFFVGLKDANIVRNFQLNSTLSTFTLAGINIDSVKNYPIVAIPQSYLVGTTGIDYFSTRRLEASSTPFVMTLQSNGNFFWYQTTQTIPIIKPHLTNRNQWILGRATHMGRRGL
jgi:hypothetical protein